jgi:eukaryotic-like serine/threonine-protein kinase
MVTADPRDSLMSVQSIFREALEQTDLSQRAASLDRACAGDPDLRRRVEDLLRAYDQASVPLEYRIADPDATADVSAEKVATATAEPSPLAEAAGSRIGPYKLLQLIGEGGMGAVYMAEQEKPIRRRIALKIIKAGMDTSQVIARFEAERQALALMDHPNIAKVLDAGATGTNCPLCPCATTIEFVTTKRPQLNHDFPGVRDEG